MTLSLSKKKGKNQYFFKTSKVNRVIESKNAESLANQKDAIFLNKLVESAFVLAL